MRKNLKLMKISKVTSNIYTDNRNYCDPGGLQLLL